MADAQTFDAAQLKFCAERYLYTCVLCVKTICKLTVIRMVGSKCKHSPCAEQSNNAAFASVHVINACRRSRCISPTEQLYALYSQPNTIRVIKERRLRWAGHVACIRDRRVANRVLVGKPEGMRPLGRLRHRWEENIKMDLREVIWEGHGLDRSGSV
jgi:hypothetical protein